MTTVLDRATQYRAIFDKDKRYNGIFYFAVKGTGVYCRPSCSVPTPLQKTCSFFSTVEKAEARGYRACKRCHPSRLKHDLSSEILNSISNGSIDAIGVRGLADSLHISERQLRRIVQARTHTSPLRLSNAKRAGAAKRLIVKTRAPIIEVAFAVGFSSLRQFNDVFKEAFKASPREIRRLAIMKDHKVVYEEKK